MRTSVRVSDFSTIIQQLNVVAHSSQKASEVKANLAA
jgi:hypothetical protein